MQKTQLSGQRRHRDLPAAARSAHTKMLEAFNHDPNDEAAGVRLMGTFIENGLRAQARSGNLLTGQL